MHDRALSIFYVYDSEPGCFKPLRYQGSVHLTVGESAGKGLIIWRSILTVCGLPKAYHHSIFGLQPRALNSGKQSAHMAGDSVWK